MNRQCWFATFVLPAEAEPVKAVKAVAPSSARYDALSILDGRKLGEVNAAKLAAGWTAPFDTNRRVTIVELKRRY